LSLHHVYVWRAALLILQIGVIILANAASTSISMRQKGKGKHHAQTSRNSPLIYVKLFVNYAVIVTDSGGYTWGDLGAGAPVKKK
jgi:hypothetical protein